MWQVLHNPSSVGLLLCNCCFLEQFFGAFRAAFLCRTSQRFCINSEIRLQVACSLPSNLHVSTHPNPGYYTEYRELSTVFLLQGVVLNKNTNRKFDLLMMLLSSLRLVNYSFFNSESFQHGSGWFLWIFFRKIKKTHCRGFHSTKVLVQCIYKAEYILFCEVL